MWSASFLGIASAMEIIPFRPGNEKNIDTIECRGEAEKLTSVRNRSRRAGRRVQVGDADLLRRPVHVRQRQLHPAHLPVRRRQRLSRQLGRGGPRVRQSQVRRGDRVHLLLQQTVGYVADCGRLFSFFLVLLQPCATGLECVPLIYLFLLLLTFICLFLLVLPGFTFFP